MQTLALAMRAAGEEGAPLPPVFPQLEEIGAKIRRGMLTMIASVAGGGKSAIATELVVNLVKEDGTKADVLYFSADTDRMTLGKRAAAGVMDCTLDEAEEWLNENEHGIWDQFHEATKHIWFCFDPSLSLTDIDEEVTSYAEVAGNYPDVIVIDVLINVVGDDGEDGHVVYHRSMEYLHQLARITGSAIIVLHHVVGGFDGNSPIPRSGILGKIDKLQRLILTLWRPDQHTMGISVVKNTNGPADAMGINVMARVLWQPVRSFFGRNVAPEPPPDYFDYSIYGEDDE